MFKLQDIIDLQNLTGMQQPVEQPMYEDLPPLNDMPYTFESGGMGGGEPQGSISDKIQQFVGAKEPQEPNTAQSILANRFTPDQGLAYGDYLSAGIKSLSGAPTQAQDIADSRIGNQFKTMAAVAKLGQANKIPSAIQEYEYFSQLSPEQQKTWVMGRRGGLLGPGQFLDQQGNAELIPGFTDNRQQTKAAESAGTKEGGARGEAIASYNSQMATYPELQRVVGKLSDLAKTATYTKIGQATAAALRQAGRPVPQGAIDRAQYQAVVRDEILPLLRQTFGAQFTEAEGLRLEATLGDPNLSPPERQAALDAFLESKSGSLRSAAREAGMDFGGNVPTSGPDLQDPGFLQFLKDRGY